MSRNMEHGMMPDQDVYEMGSREDVRKELEAEIEQLKGQLIGLQNSPFKEKEIKNKIAFLEEQRNLLSLNGKEDQKAA
ncbi:MAG: hypothetical protein ACM3NH_02345 [Candidatus Saccharibacteria bacterium]